MASDTSLDENCFHVRRKGLGPLVLSMKDATTCNLCVRGLRVRASGVIHERFLGLFRWSESSFVDFRFKAREVERQRFVRVLCAVVDTSESTTRETRRPCGESGFLRRDLLISSANVVELGQC